VVIGARFGGLTVVHWVHRLFARTAYRGIVVDTWPTMVYRPGLVHAFRAEPGFVRQYRVSLAPVAAAAGFEFIEDRAIAVDPERQTVHLAAHRPLHYDVLFLATGSDPGWTTIPGLDVTRGGICEDYLARQTAIDRRGWQGGTFLFAVGPLHANPEARVRLATANEFMVYESALLWADTCTRRRVRKSTRIVLLTPAPVLGEALGPSGRARLQEAMERAGIEVRTGVRYRAVTDQGIRLTDGFERADQMVFVPPYVGSGLARTSRLDDGFGWVPVTPHLQHPSWPNIYVVGDITTHVPKLGHAAMVQARVAVHHWYARVNGKSPPPPYHPQVLALIEMGRGQGLFSLSTVLYGGSRDVTAVGRPARWAKLAFNRLYVTGRGWLPVMP
jgi:sulfide:quinone oxidoreductase